MPSEKNWSRFEKFNTIATLALGVLCAYWTAGSYYGWNTPSPESPAPKVAAVTATHVPWFVFVVGGLAVALLVTSWVMIGIRLWTRKHPAKVLTASFSPRAAMATIAEIHLITSDLGQISPWLKVYFVIYNASGYLMRPISISGRMRVNGQELHGTLELDDQRQFRPADNFFNLWAKLPVTREESAFLLNPEDNSGWVILFRDVAIEFQIASEPNTSMVTIHPPEKVSISRSTCNALVMQWQK